MFHQDLKFSVHQCLFRNNFYIILYNIIFICTYYNITVSITNIILVYSKNDLTLFTIFFVSEYTIHRTKLFVIDLILPFPMLLLGVREGGVMYLIKFTFPACRYHQHRDFQDVRFLFSVTNLLSSNIGDVYVQLVRITYVRNFMTINNSSPGRRKQLLL